MQHLATASRSDKLNGREEFALIAVGAASAFNVLLWSLGLGLSDAEPALTPLGVLRVAFAVSSFVSMDLVVIVTVMAMRAGRRGIWSEVCSATAALAAAGIALEVAGVVSWPWLHAAPMVVLYTFMRHLAAPPAEQRAAHLARQLAQTETEAAQLRGELAQRDSDLGTLRKELERALAQLETEAVQREAATAQFDTEQAQAQRQVAQLQGALAQARHELERRQVEDGAIMVEITGARYSLRDASEALELSPTTLARKLKTVAQKDANGGRP